MTQMIYNGIDFGLMVRTHEVKMDPVMDDTGTDRLYDRVEIACECIVNPFALSVQIQNGQRVNADGSGPGLTLAYIRHALMQPRKQLVYAIGPDRVITSPPNDPNTGQPGR